MGQGRLSRASAFLYRKVVKFHISGPHDSPEDDVTIICESKSHHSTGPTSSSLLSPSGQQQQNLISRLVNYNYSQCSAVLQNCLYCESHSFMPAMNQSLLSSVPRLKQREPSILLSSPGPGEGGLFLWLGS